MPYINVKLNTAITKEKAQALRGRLGKAIETIGKSEAWLMIGIEQNCTLYFKDSDTEPTVYVEVKLLNSAGGAAYEKLTAVITQIFADELGIKGTQLYVSYFETSNWGWNGSNF